MKLLNNMDKKTFLALGVLLVVLSIIPHFSKLSTITLISRIFILAVYGMSYDILRGYTGFINLGHALFFGSGAYIAGIFFTNFGNNLVVFGMAVIVTVVFCSLAAYIMGKIVLRGGGVIAAAMITLALGEIVRNIAERWRSVTMGADGLPFKIPDVFRDRIGFYYYALIFLIIMTVVLRQFILSPTGRVLMAIRENEQRAEFLGYETSKYKLIGLQVAGIASGLAGIMFGILNRFANTDLLSVQQTLNALLITLVGGTGTLYGAIVGSAFVNAVQNYLLNLRSVHPIFERWLLFFGAMYVIVVLFMPEGFVGLWNKYMKERRTKKNTKAIEKGL
ncbi:branched-chain amino acid ABC transporter permease [Alkaliphilus peptidifermentans]|uniref:Branched-chain amino acid transport system permease protein n=1 Tax=Alkaliphilus peptidifermentans DSM 18978 TaxID=1120976 RepID=A0A1G5ABU7_9FIRM|nr:branched-chain amino acid ABC transporter permease [Alkaliphilus peptidifermentans]SCX75390.1 branched-chain amino acid transport system permease protein [Alkaliphilus peptidifermentans DSM 18978]